MVPTDGGEVVKSRYEMSGAERLMVALVYVPGWTELKPTKVRSPIKRAKSTVVGMESTETAVEPLFSVMLLRVTLKANTEGRGASSPVINMAAAGEALVLGWDEPVPPQPIIIASKAGKIANNRNRFMANSGFSRFEEQ